MRRVRAGLTTDRFHKVPRILEPRRACRFCGFVFTRGRTPHPSGSVCCLVSYRVGLEIPVTKTERVRLIRLQFGWTGEGARRSTARSLLMSPFGAARAVSLAAGAAWRRGVRRFRGSTC